MKSNNFARRADGSLLTVYVPCENIQTRELAWQSAGLMFTATGYGSRIPTPRMVSLGGKLHRVYCAIYSNAGSAYIQKGGVNILVSF